MEAIKIKDVNFTYPKEKGRALDNINISIEEGEIILVCGLSGCGKSTLLKTLKPELTPYGDFTGEIEYYGKNIKSYSLRETASQIGYVLQNPEGQIVTDKVYHELAFGLENLGYDSGTIRRRVAEMSSFFGIGPWFRKDVSELSGGQKQLLNLASIMVMEPKVLILDEPTSQLDPIAAKEFIDTIVRINRELSTTIVIVEHNLEELFPLADKVLLMEEGKVKNFGAPKKVALDLCEDEKNKMVKALPTSIGIYKELGIKTDPPLDVREGKKFLRNILGNKIEKDEIKRSFPLRGKEEVIKVKNLYFTYDKKEECIIRDLSFTVKKGEFYSILGGNGVGKSTALSLISKNKAPLSGKISILNKPLKTYKGNSLYNGVLGIVPQNPQSLFNCESVLEDLKEVSKDENEIKNLSETLGMEGLLNKHPYDLSGGEIQKGALLKVLLLKPQILILDEPTKGLDYHGKEEVGNLLLKLKNEGKTIVLVSHDIEFCAKYSDICGMFFDGNIICEGNPVEFFKGNKFYTTVANRISRDFFKDGITRKDVIKLCKLNLKLRGE